MDMSAQRRLCDFKIERLEAVNGGIVRAGTCSGIVSNSVSVSVASGQMASPTLSWACDITTCN